MSDVSFPEGKFARARALGRFARLNDEERPS
jgi:hypothetical protein